jgi:hypothetical protein
MGKLAPRNADGYTTAGHSSARFRILTVLGWLCIAATIARVGLRANLITTTVRPYFRDEPLGLVVLVSGLLAEASLGLAIGVGLLIGARAFRPNGKSGRFKLWAKLLFLAAVELSLAFPIFCYNVVFFIQFFGHDPTAGPMDPLGREVLGAAALFSSIPFAIGLGALAVALIWGRREPPPDVAVVFS